MSERCRNAILISILLLIPLGATDLPATTYAVSPQFDWTIEIGDCEIGARGWHDQTELKLVFDNFNLPVSGWTFLSCVAPVGTAFCTLVFYLLWRRTKVKPSAALAADR